MGNTKKSDSKCSNKGRQGGPDKTGIGQVQQHNAYSNNTSDLLSQTSDLLYGHNTGQQTPMNCTIMPTMQNVQPVMQCQEQMRPLCQNYQTNTMNNNVPNPVLSSAQQPMHGHFMQTAHQLPQANVATDNGTPAWATNLFQQLTSIQQTVDSQNTRWQLVENLISEQNRKMMNLESQLKEITGIKREMTQTCTNISGIQTELKTLKGKMTEYDNTIQQYSDMCDDLTANNSDVDSKVNTIMKQIHSLQDQQTELMRKYEETTEKITDIRWRNMRENLVFSGIDEATQFKEKGENCEDLIQEFIKNELQITDNISFDRVHRLGRFNPRHRYPRPIVAKFTYYKDKERVKQTAVKKLKHTNYWVKDHYPQEIEERRKQLYQAAKTARQDPNNKVRLVRDKLFINNRQYFPAENTANTADRHQNRNYPMYNGNHVNNLTHATRNTDYRPSTERTRTNTYNEQPSARPKYTASAVRTSNRFEILQTQDVSTPNQRASVCNSFKKKATSPLDQTDRDIKKPHIDDYGCSDSEESTILCDIDTNQPPLPVATPVLEMESQNVGNIAANDISEQTQI